MNSGTFFTIYDFFGYQTGSQVAPNGLWSNTTNAAGNLFLGPNPTLPPNPPSVDRALVNNLSWQWVGGVRNGGVGGLNLGNFTALSNIGTVGSGIYGEQIRNPNSSSNNHSIPTPTPEPGTMAMYGVGLIGLIGFYRGRRSRKAEDVFAA